MIFNRKYYANQGYALDEELELLKARLKDLETREWRADQFTFPNNEKLVEINIEKNRISSRIEEIKDSLGI